MRLPDFIIGGAPRSGTTWLYRALALHPAVQMAIPERPEPKFFLVDDLYRRGLAHYSERWFRDASDGCILGEKSTNYLESKVAARRIHDSLPDVKLVFLLREPGARAYSNYLWSRMNGMETESFADALRLEDERERRLSDSLRFARPHAYFSRGLYAEHLSEYFSLFPRKAIMCARFEDIAESPRKLLDCIHGFLGIEPRPGDAEGLNVVNAASPDPAGFPPDTREMLWERYAEPNRRLAELLGPEFEIWERE